MKSRKSNRKAAKKRQTASQKRSAKRKKLGGSVARKRKKTASQKRRDKRGRFIKKRKRDSKGRFLPKRPRGKKEVKWIFDRYDDVSDDLGTAMDIKEELTQEEFLNILRGLGLEEHDAYTLWFY